MIQSSTQRNIVGIAAAAVVACSGMASADVVRVTAEGVIDGSPQLGDVMVGDAFSFWFDVDLSMTANSSPDSFIGSYDSAVVGFGASVASISVSGSGPSAIDITHDTRGDPIAGDIDAVHVVLNSNDDFSHPMVTGIRFELVHFGGDFFDSIDLDEVMNLNDINVWDESRSFSLYGQNLASGAGGQVTSISVETIPAPSSLAMLGCFGAVATRRRR